jgi:uncharacterized repeat protein (TIGR03803 family)
MPSIAAIASRRSSWTGLCVLCACTLLIAEDAFAQGAFTLVHKFYSGARLPAGRLVEAPDGSLYGTTFCGGEPYAGCTGGTIFALRPQPGGLWTFEDVHHLRDNLHGGWPFAGLTLARDGRLYGIATYRGAAGTGAPTGTIFRMNASDGSLERLHVFTGDDPVWRLAEASDGNLYGATCHGPYNERSTLFRITPSGALTTLHTLPVDWNTRTAPQGFCPVTQLVEGQDGFLYGTAAGGGPPLPGFPQVPSFGTLFRFDPRLDSAPLTVLHTFRGFLDGAGPTGGLTPGASGEFFGTTIAGGLFAKGTVYRLDPSGAVSTLHSFRALDGVGPFGGLVRATDGALYGSTLGGGVFGHGTLFRIDASGLSSVHFFAGADGSRPVELMQARDGNFYGVASAGGPGAGGTVFRLGPANSLTTLHAFAAGPRETWYGVIQATDGNFYGTTLGSSLGGGAIFRMTPSGEVTVLHDFEPTNDGALNSETVGPTRLVQAADGYLYGRTAFGGVHDRGTVFRISISGEFTRLHSFDRYSGGEGLIRGIDGHLYGATAGDSTSAPIVFRVEPSGQVTTLYVFDGSGVSSVVGPLTQGDDGALYGIAFGAGAFNVGGIFRIATNGTFAIVHSFSSSSPDVGYLPTNGLIRSVDGGFYGTTRENLFGPPCIYRFDPATNAVTAVARLQAGATLLEASDGGLYGWAQTDLNQTWRGRFFRATSSGVTYLHDIADGDGRYPSVLIEAADGALYGTVAMGPYRPSEEESWDPHAFAGAVFRLTIPQLPAASGGQ